MKLGRVGTVAIDSTRIKAAAPRNRLERVEQLRQERAGGGEVRAWQKQCDADDPNEGAGMSVIWKNCSAVASDAAALGKTPQERAEEDVADRRGKRVFTGAKRGFVLGYTGESGGE